MDPLKEKVIAAAYTELGFDWEQLKEYIEEDGRLTEYNAKYRLRVYDHIFTVRDKGSWYLYSWLPDTLIGIENNNGWLSVENLPNKELDVHIIYDNTLQTTGIWDNTLKAFYSGSNKLHNVTHYQPIVRPAPPLY
jgi:hypothetical protein